MIYGPYEYIGIISFISNINIVDRPKPQPIDYWIDLIISDKQFVVRGFDRIPNIIKEFRIGNNIETRFYISDGENSITFIEEYNEERNRKRKEREEQVKQK